MMLRVGFKTDKGMLRGNNEDALFVLPQHKLYIVADGVGGHLSGEIASRMAVKLIAQYVDDNPIERAKNDDELKRYFLKCLRHVNEQVYKTAEADPGSKGMATTVVLLYVRKGVAYVVNVGDSRAYLVRERHMVQITEDHTYVNQLLKTGSISKAEAERHPERNMITRAVGADISIHPDFFQFQVYPSDVIILCSDGLHGELSDEEICAMTLGRRSMHKLAEDYVKTANEHGGKDNVTVICVKI